MQISLPKFKTARLADEYDFKLHLFRSQAGAVCGWFIGPITLEEGRVSMPYLAKSQETLAMVAAVRAIDAAESAKARLCVIDPENLWN